MLNICNERYGKGRTANRGNNTNLLLRSQQQKPSGRGIRDEAYEDAVFSKFIYFGCGKTTPPLSGSPKGIVGHRICVDVYPWYEMNLIYPCS